MAGSRSSQVSKWSGELSTKYWNRCPFRVESADTARKPGNGPTARFLAPPLPDVPPSPKNAATGRLDLLAAVWLSGCWSGRAVKGGGGGWRGPQRSEDTGHPRKAQRPLTDLERPTLCRGAGRSKRSAAPPCSRGSRRRGRGGKAKPRQGQRPLAWGPDSPPSGGLDRGKGSRRAAVGEPRRGAPCLGTPAAPEVAHRPGFGSGVFCWFFSCFFLFFCARARGLPAKPYLARVCGGF